jgi:tetratricopeptide (TPR) repeat protein
MLRIDEGFLPAYRNLAEAYFRASRYDDAIQVLGKAILISDGGAYIKAHLGFAYARSGKIREARTLLRELEDESGRRYVAPIAFALIHCGLGENAKAIAWLHKACEEHAGSAVLSVKVRPMWATLRSEPAFARLLKRMGVVADVAESRTVSPRPAMAAGSRAGSPAPPRKTSSTRTGTSGTRRRS